MSTITTQEYQARMDGVARHPALAHDNVNLREGAGVGASTALLAVGAGGVLLTLVGAAVHGPKHAMAAYMVGVYTVLAICLGGLFWTMVFQLVNAGWTATVRRQLENLMSLIPLALVLMLPIFILEVVGGGVMFTWLDPSNATDPLLAHKAGWLNPMFFGLRFIVYAALWGVLAMGLWRASTEQDRTGDRWLTSKARKMSGWGLPLFALSIAFVAFDWIMSVDYRFFSTMWGVYYFASVAQASLCVVVIVLAVLRVTGRLTGAVTMEHFHDLGKLIFGFTVFWAYITFSQYFLIWYSNIPEESAYYVIRRQNGWENLAVILSVGHFIAPFLILLVRRVKESTLGLAVMAVWMLLMIAADLVWNIRPMVYAGAAAESNPGPTGWWLDAVGLVGPIAIFAGLLVRRVAGGPLVAIKDPRMDEELHHKNYV